MKFNIVYDTRIKLRGIYFLLLSILLISLIPLKSLSLWLIILGVMSCIFITYDGVICFETHYIYFKRKEEQVSPIKDSPVKLTDIAGYSVNNPFPSYSPWCKSSYNLTLYLLNGKYKTFSVKEQSMFVDWLKEKNISCISKTSRESIIEHISYTVANIFFIVFYSYQLKIGYTESGFTCLLISFIYFVYWIIYILSGLFIRKKVLYDETLI